MNSKIKNIFLLLFFCNISFITLFGQSFLWKFGNTTSSESGTAILNGPTGELYVGGMKNDSCLLVRLDPSGSVAWEYTFKMSSGKNMINSLQITSDGFLIGTAQTVASSPWGSMGYFKFSLNGNLIWIKKITSAHYIRNLVEKNSTRYLCTMVYWNSSGSTDHNFVNIEIDAANGNILNTYSNYDLTTSGLSDYLDDIYQTTPYLYNNKFYAAGRLYNGSGANDRMRPYIAAFDQNGSLIWVKHYIGNTSMSARVYSNHIFRDADTLMLGIFGDYSGTNLGICKFGYIKTDINGNDLAQVYYDITGVTSERLFGFVNLPDGYLFYGYTHPFSSGESDIFLIKVRKNGDVIWSYKLGNPGVIESIYNETLPALVTDGNYAYFTGQTGTNSSGPFDLFVGKMDLYNPANFNSCLSLNPITVNKINLPSYNSAPTFNPLYLNISNTAQTVNNTFLPDNCNSYIEFTADSLEVSFPYTISPIVTGNSPDSYLWNNGSNSQNITVNSPGWYVLSAYYDCCPLITDSIYIDLNCNITESIIGSTTFCLNDNITLSLMNGSYNYTWNDGSTNTSVSFPATIDTTITLIVVNGNCIDTLEHIIEINYNNVGISGQTLVCENSIVTLTASGANDYLWSNGSTQNSVQLLLSDTTIISVIGSSGGVCPDTATITVNTLSGVYESLIVTVNDTICSGESITLTASGSYNYLWNDGSTTNSISLTLFADTTISLIASNTNCSDTIIQNLTVINSSVFVAGDDTICEGENLQLIASGSVDYLWSNGSQNTIQNFTPLQSDSIYVIGSTNGFCPDTAFFVYTVDIIPPMTINGDSIICEGESVNLTVSANSSFAWNSGDTSSIISFYPINDSIVFIYNTNSNICRDTIYFNLNVDPVANAQINGDTVICQGETANLFGLGGSSLNWIPVGGVGSNIYISPNEDDTLFLIATNGNCSDTTFVTFDVYPLPSNGFNINTESDGCEITVNVNDTTNLQQISWIIGNHSFELTSSVIHVFDPNEPLMVTQIVTDSNGCTNSLTTIIDGFAEGFSTLYIPNSFTPNNDGMNDFFKAEGTCLTKFKMEIFNRWGQLIFECSDINNFWNGTFLDLNSPIDIYVYKVYAEGFNETYINKYGHVSLIR